MRYTKRNNPRGFTLIEILIVTVMLSIVSLAIYATFTSGIKIWQRVNQVIPEEDLVIFFDKFAADLRNSFKFSNISFSGEVDSLEFATRINSPAFNKITVGKMVYSYAPGPKILNREQQDFSQVYTEQEGTIQQSLRNIISLKFQYYAYDAEIKAYFWQDEWEQEELPLAVKVELEYDFGRQTDKFTRTVSIPVGG